MLDLAKEKKWYEVKWFNGIILKLPILTQQELTNDFAYIMTLLDSEDVEQQAEGLMSFVKELIKRNKDGIVLNDEDYRELDLDLIRLLIEDYYQFMDDLLGE